MVPDNLKDILLQLREKKKYLMSNLTVICRELKKLNLLVVKTYKNKMSEPLQQLRKVQTS